MSDFRHINKENKKLKKEKFSLLRNAYLGIIQRIIQRISKKEIPG
jgi:hypothetical protein